MHARRQGPRIRFGTFELDLHCGELRNQGQKIRIQPQPLKVLALLLEHPGELVSRDELRARLWPNEQYIDFEHGLNRSMNKLRAALLDDANSPRYIETLSARGYRFIASVERPSASPDSPAASSPARQEKADIASPPAASAHWFRQSRMRWGVLFLLVLLPAVAAVKLWPRINGRFKSQHARVPKVETRRFVYVADFSGNSVLAYSVDPSSGILEPVSNNPFKAGEHPYALSLIGDSYLYAANRGRTDEVCGGGCNISAYAVDRVSGGLVQLDASPIAAGNGPVDIAMHPSGKFLYLVNGISNNLQTYSRSPGGDLQPLGLPLPLGTHPFVASISHSGHYLYVSNQDDATISAFAIGIDGLPRPVQGSPFATGLRPRSIAIDRSERRLYVLNYGVNPHLDRREACVGQYGNARGRGCTISAFAIDKATGALTELAGSITSNDVSVYEINSVSGALHPIKGSPFPAGQGPTAIALDWSDSFLYVLNAFSHDISQFAIEDDGRLTPMSSPVPAGLGPIAIVAIRNEKN